MSTTPPNPAGAPVPIPVAPAGSTSQARIKVGKTPFAPPWLPRPWYAGAWDSAAGDWSLQPEWFATWDEAWACGLDLCHVQLWLDELDA